MVDRQKLIANAFPVGLQPLTINRRQMLQAFNYKLAIAHPLLEFHTGVHRGRDDRP
jgi:hypothetical protein